MSTSPKNFTVPTPRQEQPPSLGYEVEDAQPHLIGVVAAIVAGGIVFTLLTAGWLYRIGYREVSGPARQTSFTGGATYRSSVATEWTALDRENADRLHEYAWIDRQKAIVRIPIDQAMSLLVSEASHAPSSSSNPKQTP